MNRKVLIAISSGIAAYKVCEVVSTLVKSGVEDRTYAETLLMGRKNAIYPYKWWLKRQAWVSPDKFITLIDELAVSPSFRF
ncbi:MAG: hypothetical protein F6K17_00540 [Okeania sp. SIO3C4]|nr:hypothetical protein [Okeania sp. SIO3B3]NER01233.1 hypothetical protein [Okeania sp. SIO3C4]